MKTSLYLPVLLLWMVSAQPTNAQATSIVNTKHNLSTSGPGTYVSSNESRICIFCHTPHRARTTAPLWNREDSRETYLVYSSSTFGGVVGQPGGSSKLCLSCHDGSIALGNVVHSDTTIQMQPGKEFLTSGSAALGVSLNDDHPISFNYNTSKGGSGQEYVPDSAIPEPVHLDAAGDVQCTSCHDAHDNQYGNFLLTSARQGGLCLSCHQPDDWNQASHRLSAATWDGSGTDPWPNADYDNVADNACANCHTPHSAGQPERLLEQAVEEDNCLKCHNGHVASTDIANDVARISAHSPFPTLGVHDPVEDVFSMPRHAECQDCHDPHSARPGSAAPPGVPGPILGVSGVSGSGQFVPRINEGYQLCYKCHADNNGGTGYLPRAIQQTNVRFEFDPQNPSYHPIEAPGANLDVPSLLPPYTTASIITCTDCHQSDTSPDAGGNGAAGPHGSQYRPLLIARYDTQEYVTESPSTYALCYRCHSRTSILNDDSFKEHKKHIQKEDAPCSACHDGHGISASQGTNLNNTHLINFNISYVSTNKNGLREFEDLGNRKGQCNLKCHGEDHKNERY